MKSRILLMTIAIFTISFNLVAQVKGTFVDSRDGKVYKTVKIGTQTWMAENMVYINHSIVYDNLESNAAIYGYLYDWETAKLVAPSGWHLPSDIEWKTLLNFLGGDSLAGGKLKESGTTHWYNNTNATNESGFTGLPGGFCMPDGKFNFNQVGGFWWSSTEKSTTDAWFCSLGFNSGKITSGPFNKGFKISVRCVKDQSTSKLTTPTETKNNKIEDNTIVIKGTLFSSDLWGENAEAFIQNPHKEKVKVMVGVNWVTIKIGYNEKKYKISSIETPRGMVRILVDGAIQGLANTITFMRSDNGYSYDISMDEDDGFFTEATKKDIDIIEETTSIKIENKGYSDICEAISRYDADAVRRMVKEGADLNKTYEQTLPNGRVIGYIPINKLFSTTDELSYLKEEQKKFIYEMFLLFINNGLDPNPTPSTYGYKNPVICYVSLPIFSKEQTLSLFRALLDNKADINAVDRFNQNALNKLCDSFLFLRKRDCSEIYEIAKFLLENGADPTIEDNIDHETALKKAKKNYKCKELDSLLKSYSKK